MARKINLNRQLLGLEDILFGEGTETQTRNGQEVIISKINIGNLPFNETQTLLEWLNSTDVTTLISSIPELLSIYENLPMLSELDTNTTDIINAINKYLGLSVTITTLNPGEQATASYNTLTGVLSLGIPKGDIGDIGPKGDTGDIGPKGDIGDIGPKGDTGDIGPQGPKGDTGNSIESVIKTSGNSAPGTTDTYTITFTDLSTSTFTVYNGANGTGSGDMHTNTYDTNSNGIVDNAQMLSLDLTNTTPPNIGQIKWNQDEGTADLGLYGAVLQVGQEFLIKVRAGTNLTSGTVVMASGSIGTSGRIVVTAHDGTQANASRVLGILTEDIEAGADGFATIIGKVRNINTTGTLIGESWLDGDKLYVKPSDTGHLTKVEPIDTEIKMSIAYVINAHTNGTLYVRVTGFDENHYKNWVTNLLDTKVDKVPGKGLSTEDYTSTEKTKLNGIANNANNYSHPDAHDASMITESTTKRFVSDTEKNSWNSKAPLSSPAFTNNPTAPTQTTGDNSTKLATTEYVDRKFTRGTAVATTSGTAIDFTGIPSWAKKITVMMKDISLSGVSHLLIQIGNTTIQTTGYNSSSGGGINATVPAVAGSTAGFVIYNDVATDAFTAIMKIYNITANSYIEEFTRGGLAGRTIFGCGGGSVTLSGILNRIRITTVSGTDTFDAGQINIMYEG